MPRYYFVVHTPKYMRLDLRGTDLPDAETAYSHAKLIVKELREDGFNQPCAKMAVQDEAGNILHSIPL